MNDTTITGLPTALGIDPVADWLAIDRTSLDTTQKINRNILLGISGNPVGTSDSQTLSNKTLNNTTSLTIKDSNFLLQSAADATKQVTFDLTAITTGTTRTIGLPDASGVITLIAATQTLTNKTLTSPTINGGTISNASIAADAIVGFTVSGNGTVYGLTINSGVIQTANSVTATNLATNSVATAAIQNNAVTPNKLATGASSATVATSESTASGTPADLATPGPSVTITIGVNGLALIITQAQSSSGTTNAAGLLWVVVSGATTVAAVEIAAQRVATAQTSLPVGAYLMTGLTAGSNTFKLQYSTTTGTQTFSSRVISVIPL